MKLSDLIDKRVNIHTQIRLNQLSEAYQTLVDPQKREAYCQNTMLEKEQIMTFGLERPSMEWRRYAELLRAYYRAQPLTRISAAARQEILSQSIPFSPPDCLTQSDQQRYVLTLKNENGDDKEVSFPDVYAWINAKSIYSDDTPIAVDFLEKPLTEAVAYEILLHFLTEGRPGFWQ